MSLLTTAFAFASATDFGGWDEEIGEFVIISDQEIPVSKGVAGIMSSTPRHSGTSEQKIINGTTNKRAHGWTTWTGEYHYTTAQMEDRFLWFEPRILTTSGRAWGWNGTEAISPWWAFDGDTLGSARTY